MPRLVVLAIVLVATPAFANVVVVPTTPPDLSDQAIGAELGLAIGSRVTPGGLRVEGHYIYRLSQQAWFDGTAGFTFGGGGAACFRDRSNIFVCDHGLTQGDAAGLSAGVRHFMMGQGQFWPFLTGGVGLRLVHFSGDAVTGLAVPVYVGGGIRASITQGVAITAQGQFELGFGAFNHTLGVQPQLGVAITAGVEFRL